MEDRDLERSAKRGAARARALAELAVAIAKVQEAAENYDFPQEHALEALALTTRLEAIRIEVEDLRRGGWRTPVQMLGSKRINLRLD